MFVKILKKADDEKTWFDHEVGNIIEVVDSGLYYKCLDENIIKKYVHMKSFYAEKGLFVVKKFCEVVEGYSRFKEELDKICDL
jgi:hypothetical protein